MDGTLFLERYKLKHRITLNLQKHTILLSHADMFTPTILFDMIERYFNKQNFSDTYQKSVHIRLNEKKLSPTDFQVWRIRPDVNVEEELKIAKKTLLGQYLEQLYRGKQTIFECIGHTVEKELLNELNVMLKRYDMRLECDEQNIYTFAKMLSLGTYMAEEEVLPSEYSQYQAKQFLLDLIDDIEAKKPKLLLLDEHTAALDPKTAAKVLELSDKIISENNLTAMMVTHNMRDAIVHGNRLIMMNEGKVILDIKGEEKKKLTVEDLLQKFEEVSGEEFANDKALLG